MYARRTLVRDYVHRSTDYGEHWTPFKVQLPDSTGFLDKFQVGTSGKLYAIMLKQVNGFFKRHLYRSVDEGVTWSLLNAPLNFLAVWETPSGALLGRRSDEVRRSTDGGFNWQSTGLNTEYPDDYSRYPFIYGSDGKILLVDRDQDLLFYSLDDGQSWNSGNMGPITNANVDFTMMPSGTLFRLHQTIQDNPRFYRSTDWGTQWQVVDLTFSTQELPNSVVQLSGGRLLLSTTERLYFSDDDGLSWAPQVSSPEKPTLFFPTVPLADGSLIGMTKARALFRSSDQGVTWNFSAFGMRLGYAKQIALVSDSTHLSVASTGLWRSGDAGNTWERLLADTAFSYLVDRLRPIAAINADSFAVSIGKTLWRTTNGGQQFSDITPPHKLLINHLCLDGGRHLFATDSFGIIRSADFGLTWQSVLPGRKLIKLQQHVSGALFIATVGMGSSPSSFNRKIYRSMDAGVNWTLLNTDLPFGINEMIIRTQGEVWVIGLGANHVEMIRSNDLGETWTRELFPVNFTEGPAATNALDHPFLSAELGQHNIFTTVDEGQSWYALPPHGGDAGPKDIEVSPSGYLYAVGDLIYRTNQSTHIGGYIRGALRGDIDADCSTPDDQNPLKKWVVEASGEQTYVGTTSNAGKYSIYGVPGEYTVSARSPQNLWWMPCNSPLTVQIDSAQITDSVDFAIVPTSQCPLMTADVAIPQLRRCFNNTVYVAYCNAGSEPADSAWVDIELDAYLSIVNSMHPYEPLGNNTYRFYVGDVDWGDCGQFTFDVYVHCDSTVLGQTHCIVAHAFPDTLCNPVPDWSGATVEARAVCQDTMVRLELHNITETPSETLDYIIIEDDVVLFGGQKQYDGGESIQLEYPANGHTWRIESQQESGHPFSNVALAFLEGCGGFQSLGYINQFSVNGWVPSINRVCVENTGSYDPNDKQGFPLGYHDNHRIRPGQALEYLIRFQNTGTATALNVQIKDTLSVWLDLGTFRPGASSHPYTWNLSDTGILTFKFDNIMLPDSNENFAGSQGFVSFYIDQRPEVPLETQILNSAAIYFDFNEPVITNQTLHTVGIDYITSVQDLESSMPAIGIQPNPASQETLLHLPAGAERLLLFDVLGRPQRMLQVRGSQFRLERGNLPSGVYWLRAEDRQGQVTGVGKVIWR